METRRFPIERIQIQFSCHPTGGGTDRQNCPPLMQSINKHKNYIIMFLSHRRTQITKNFIGNIQFSTEKAKD